MKVSECLMFILVVVGILFLALTQSKCTRGGGSTLDLFIRFRETQIPVEVHYMGTARDVLRELVEYDSKLGSPPNQLFHFGEQLPLPLDVPLAHLNVSYGDTLSLQRYVSWTPSSSAELREAVRTYRPGESPDIRFWDTSNINNMSGLFEFNKNFNEDISGWNTSGVTNMNGTFYEASAFNQDISGWDTSNVTDMYAMFFKADAFNQDISGWNTSKVENMYSMFHGARSFNQDISGWNTSKVENMEYMFQHADSMNPDFMPRG